jgi:hypothetical protein
MPVLVTVVLEQLVQLARPVQVDLAVEVGEQPASVTAVPPVGEEDLFLYSMLLVQPPVLYSIVLAQSQILLYPQNVQI